MVRAMNRYVAAAVMWGVALGAIVYRYAILPFDWSSPWKHVLPGIAIGLAVAANQIVRMGDDTSAKRPALPLLLALGAVGGLLAFGLSYVAFPTLERAALERRELPGFSISIPSGDVVEDRREYDNGKLALKNVGNSKGVVFVQWELGGAMESGEFQVLAGLMSKALGVEGDGRVETLNGPDRKPVNAIVFRNDDASFVMSMLPCGVRHVMIATGGPDDTWSLHERIIATFACAPDPARESTAQLRFPLVLDLPGWYAAEREVDQMQITDGKTGSLSVRAAPPNLKVDLGMLIEPMFKAAGVEARITKRAGDRVWLTMSDGSDSMNGWARLVPCPDASALVIALAVDQAALDDLYNRVSNARCLRKGEKAQEWPDAPPAAAPVPATAPQ